MPAWMKEMPRSGGMNAPRQPLSVPMRMGPTMGMG